MWKSCSSQEQKLSNIFTLSLSECLSIHLKNNFFWQNTSFLFKIRQKQTNKTPQTTITTKPKQTSKQTNQSLDVGVYLQHCQLLGKLIHACFSVICIIVENGIMPRYKWNIIYYPLSLLLLFAVTNLSALLTTFLNFEMEVLHLPKAELISGSFPISCTEIKEGQHVLLHRLIVTVFLLQNKSSLMSWRISVWCQRVLFYCGGEVHRVIQDVHTPSAEKTPNL